MHPQEPIKHVQLLTNSFSITLIKTKIKCAEIESGFKTISFAFTAWIKLITGTQDDFTPIGMSDRDLFFYMLTGDEFDRDRYSTTPY
jgi:hypothetical protein